MVQKPDYIKIAIRMADDKVAIMLFVTNDYRGCQQEPTPDNIESAILKSFQQRDETPVEWKIIKEEDIPADRSYRDAWRLKQGLFSIDMPAAIDIHISWMRRRRAVMLDDLDKEYIRADEIADESEKVKAKKAIALKKQKLRNITAHPDVINAGSADELKKLTIEYLLEK